MMERITPEQTKQSTALDPSPVDPDEKFDHEYTFSFKSQLTGAPTELIIRMPGVSWRRTLMAERSGMNLLIDMLAETEAKLAMTIVE